METISFKAPVGTKKKLSELASARGETVSRFVWSAVDERLEAAGRGSSLGACGHMVITPSTFDPEEPAIDPDDWEMNQ